MIPIYVSPRLLAPAAALLLSTWSGVASADQVVVFDQTWVHTPELPDSHYRQPPAEGTPENWVSPVDYSQGSAWVYLEVHTKPTAQETKFQVCFEATPTYACTAQSPTYTDVGTYEWETPFSGFWSPEGEYVDWTQGVNNIANILKDTENGKPSEDNVGPEVAALYTPTEVRLVVTLVAAGSVYEPPTPTGEGTGSDSGGEGGSSSDGGAGETGGSSSGGGADDATTTNADDGAPADDDGPSPTTTAAATTTAAETSSEDGGAQDEDSSGCSCATQPGDARGWWALLGLLGLTRRRSPDRSARGTAG
jgi:MYXO-CTERM domain-containing protein